MKWSDFETVTITFLDDTTEDINITSEVVKDGVVHFWHQDGDMAPNEHVGSYPIANIKKWVRRQR